MNAEGTIAPGSIRCLEEQERPGSIKWVRYQVHPREQVGDGAIGSPVRISSGHADRDNDAARAARARIEGERGYDYRLIEDYALPPPTVDRAEIEAMALGMAEVRSMADPVLAKIAATLPDDREQYLVHAISQVFRPTPRDAPSPHMEAVRAPCWGEKRCGLDTATGTATARLSIGTGTPEVAGGR